MSRRLRTREALGGLAAALLVQTAPVHAQVSGPDLLSGPPPPPPTDVTATPISSTRIDLAWVAGDDDDDDEAVVAYRVYRDGALVGSTTDEEFSDEGLQPSTTYGYQISAVDDKQREGERSSTVTATTLADDTPPTAPTDLTAEAVSPSRIDLAWTAASDPESGIDHYRVYRNGAFRATATATSFSDEEGLIPLIPYTYVVTAVNGDGREGPPSDEAQATPPLLADDTPPTAPTDLTATPISPTRIDLAWTAAEDEESGVDEYRVYRDGEQVASTTSTAYGDTGLEPETTYRYRVTAVNGEGLEGEPSAEAAATTPAAVDDTPPTAPTDLTAAAVSPTGIDLTWSAAVDPESGIAGYRVYRDGALVGPASGTSFSDAGLEPETTYGYEVAAVNGEGLEGPRSARTEATTPGGADTTPPAPPTGLRVLP